MPVYGSGNPSPGQWTQVNDSFPRWVHFLKQKILLLLIPDAAKKTAGASFKPLQEILPRAAPA